jgi:hypothetical protein
VSHKGGIPLTIPAELVDGKLVVYYRQSSVHVPKGTLIEWDDTRSEYDHHDSNACEDPTCRICLDRAGEELRGWARIAKEEAAKQQPS